MYSDEEILEITKRMQKAHSKHYRRAAEMILQLECENRSLREGVIAALQLREIGLATSDER